MRGQPSWFVIGRVSGRWVFDGPHVTEAKALEKGASINDWDSNDWEARMFHTSDMRQAKAIWKSEQAEKTGSMGQSLQPIRGTKTDRKTRFDELKEARGL